jgi:hypothetical protein
VLAAKILGELLSKRAEMTVVDMEAGLEHLTRSGGTLRYVDQLLVVVERTPSHRDGPTHGASGAGAHGRPGALDRSQRGWGPPAAGPRRAGRRQRLAGEARHTRPAALVDRYARIGPDGVGFLELGKLPGQVEPTVTVAFRYVLEGFRRKGWSMIADLAAGTRQPMFGWAGFARTILGYRRPVHEIDSSRTAPREGWGGHLPGRQQG